MKRQGRCVTVVLASVSDAKLEYATRSSIISLAVRASLSACLLLSVHGIARSCRPISMKVSKSTDEHQYAGSLTKNEDIRRQSGKSQ